VQVRDRGSKEQFAPSVGANTLVTKFALSLGLIVRPLPGDAVAICPPMTVTEAEIDVIFDRLEEALGQAAKQLSV